MPYFGPTMRTELIRCLRQLGFRGPYALIKQFIQSRRPAKPRSLIATLRDIQIDAPPDFAANLDLYVSGEKRAEPDLH
jgi:hypothetical protein